MEQVIKQLQSLGYRVIYEYDPITQLIQYIVWCGDKMVDVGMADEITFEEQLKEVCDCIK